VTHRQQVHLEVVHDPRCGVEIVVQSDDRMPKACAKVIYGANHAYRHPADAKAWEHMQQVLATN
jgi:hypothetical protein